MLQGLVHRAMRPSDVQQGWDLALTSSHLAVTLPTRVAAVYEFQVWFMQLCQSVSLLFESVS